MKTQKLEKQEITHLESLQGKERELIYILGTISHSRIKLEEKEENIEEQLKLLEGDYIKLAQTLQEKYGEGRINLETQEFIPTK